MKNCNQCDAEQTQICPKCEKFAYCCDQDLAFHLGPNKDACLPYKIHQSEELGKYMTAIRNIKPFETVIYDEALASGPSDFNDPCCLICLEALDNVDTVCEHCNIPWCGSEVSGERIRVPKISK